MIAKLLAVLCLIGVAHAGGLYGSRLGYGGYGSSYRSLGYGGYGGYGGYSGYNLAPSYSYSAPISYAAYSRPVVSYSPVAYGGHAGYGGYAGYGGWNRW